MTWLTPDAGEPAVSVLMVTHGSWTLTEQAIESLAANTSADFELIVFDNCSQDETRERLLDLRRVRVLLSDRNLGFGPANNEAAKHARAEHLILLNTDAFVRPGWLEPLLETASEASVGAVVPRYLHPDGTLQEAGALLAQDGTTLTYGDGEDAESYCYRFRRVIDYGGAACMLVRAQAYASLGGFDPVFEPAYYEDVDLCLRMAQRGLSVVYEPRSTATHVRHGSSAGGAAFALSERNRERFLERWGPQLGGRPQTFRGAGEQAVIAARDALATPRVLIAPARMSPGLEASLGTLLEHWPSARVTVAPASAPPDPDAERWLRAGVELVGAGEGEWLSARLFHYDLVVVDSGLEAFGDAVRRTQPQALTATIEALEQQGSEGLNALLAPAGIAPQSAVA